MRSSLAGVILRMQSLGLGSVEDFPFLEAPPKRAIADGYQLLDELGAIDDQNALTPIGRELARLPLDPRIGRMILEARHREALREVLVVASAPVSVQDVRDRPLEQQQAADQAHAKFDDEQVRVPRRPQALELAGAVARRPRRAPAVVAQARAAAARATSSRRAACANGATSTRSCTPSSPSTAGASTPRAPTYEQLHLSMLAGLLGNIGVQERRGRVVPRRARHPLLPPSGRAACRRSRGAGSSPPSWSRRRGSSRAASRDRAALAGPQLGGHLIKTQLLEPHWEKKAAQVIALERATLYGIVIYANRRVDFGDRRSGGGARDLHPRGAGRRRLGDAAAVRGRQPQADRAGRGARAQVAAPGRAGRRRADLRLLRPAAARPTCTAAQSFERWYRDEVKRQPRLLMLTREELMRHEAAGITTAAFPKTIRLGGIDCAATYLHEPGDAARRRHRGGADLRAQPVSEERCEWLVPGMLKDKVVALVKTLPQRPRSRLVPLPEYAEAFIADAAVRRRRPGRRAAAHARERTGLTLKRADFKHEQLAAAPADEPARRRRAGRQLGESRHLAS